MEPRCGLARAEEGFPESGLPLGHASLPLSPPAGSTWSQSQRVCSPGESAEMGAWRARTKARTPECEAELEPASRSLEAEKQAQG